MAPVSLRFKRKATTVFLFCEPTDTFAKIKGRVSRRPVRGGGAMSRVSAVSQQLGLCGVGWAACAVSTRADRRALTSALGSHPALTAPALQLAEHVGARDAADVRLVAADRSRDYEDAAMVSDFAGALGDDAVVLVAVGGESLD